MKHVLFLLTALTCLYCSTVQAASENDPSDTTQKKTTPPPKVISVASRPDYYAGSNESGQKLFGAGMHQSSIISFEVDPKSTPAPVALRFVGPVKGLEIQAEGQPAVGDLDGLIAALTANAETDRQKAEAIFNFVVNDVKDWYYPAQGIDLTVPDLGVLIWNFGFGFCYDLGRLTAGMWARAGLRSRITGWPQHTVAEVFYDDAWHLYDLQHRSKFEKPDGSVASFQELKADPTLFYQNLNAYGLDAISYPPHHMTHWYSIAEPNFQDSADGDHWETDRTFKMDLRPGEMFEILYTQPHRSYHPDSWFIYYGEKTLDKDPPWPLQGRQTYFPAKMDKEAEWVPATAPNGAPAHSITMKNPYFFTEAWLDIPGLTGYHHIWVEAFGRTTYLGKLLHGKAWLTDQVAGANAFTVTVQKKDKTLPDLDPGLEKVELHARLQISPIGLPSVKPGANAWPVNFESGNPTLFFWYQESAPDLALVQFRMEPEHPKPNQDVALVYTVQNKGAGPSKPTTLTVNNNVTAFMSETIEPVAVATVGPIAPGQSVEQRIYWRSNTRMTWYGKNPYVQLFDAWLDIKNDRADTNRENNRRQDHVLLSTENGELPSLPGYVDLPGTK